MNLKGSESENTKKELENIEEQIEKVKLTESSYLSAESKFPEHFEKEKQFSEEFKKVKRTHVQEEASKLSALIISKINVAIS